MTAYEWIQELVKFKPNAKVYISTPLIKTAQNDNLELSEVEIKIVNGKDVEIIVK
jgi:hypothetical protein